MVAEEKKKKTYVVGSAAEEVEMNFLWLRLFFVGSK